MLKTYYGNAGTEEHPSSVMVRTNRLKNLTHHLRHNPDGFSWGYGGSGPSELARCMLLDVFGSVDCPDIPQECQCQNNWVESSYQAFKSDVISKLVPDVDWKLEQKDMADWVFDYLEQDHEEAALPAESPV